MEKHLVLNLPFKKKPYDPAVLDNIKQWISFFVKRGIRVIATPPLERKDVFDKLSGFASESLIACPVVSFDTCDRWRAGLEKAIENQEPGYFYLWSADFTFSDESQKAAADFLDHDDKVDLLVGTIEAAGTKKRIDEVATFPLLDVWFPQKCKEIRSGGFGKPRSELLRFSSEFLTKSLKARWFPAEQTIHLILQCFSSKDKPGEKEFLAKSFPFGINMPDSEDERLSPDVIQQIERMELWFKYMWRDKNSEWDKAKYMDLSAQSHEIAKKAINELLSHI